MNANEEIRRVRLARAKANIEKAKKGILVSVSYTVLNGAAPEFRFPTECRLASATVIVGKKADLSIELEAGGSAIGYKVEGAEGIVERSFGKVVQKGDIVRFSADGQELSVTLVLQNKVGELNAQG